MALPATDMSLGALERRSSKIAEVAQRIKARMHQPSEPEEHPGGGLGVRATVARPEVQAEYVSTTRAGPDLGAMHQPDGPEVWATDARLSSMLSGR